MKNVPNHQPVMFPNTYKNCVAVRLFWLKLMPALGLSIIGSVLSTSFNAEKKRASGSVIIAGGLEHHDS